MAGHLSVGRRVRGPPAWGRVGAQEHQRDLGQRASAVPLSCLPVLSRLAGDPVCLLGLRPAGAAQLPPADGHAGEAAQTEPAALTSWALLEVC